MNLTCIAVDDEPLALQLVCKFIKQTSFLKLEESFENAIQALSYLNTHPIDLVFLDIQMPDLSGMELARILNGPNKNTNTKIIFTTAYNQFAIEGYKVDASDYLLKPFSYEEFLQAANKVFHQFQQNKEALKRPQELESTLDQDYIFLKVEYQLVKVELKKISYVEGYKDYVKVHLIDKNSPLLSLTSMKNMEELLPSKSFMRIHRSHIINLDHIQSISRNRVQIEGQQLSVSEQYKEAWNRYLARWMQ